jgi:transcriptional regulator with XRE-family HTH domain
MMDKKEFLTLLGKQIVKIRKKKGWSQSELARNCEKDRQSIERLENGKINPSDFYLKEVATGLEVRVKDLLDFEKKIPKDAGSETKP